MTDRSAWPPELRFPAPPTGIVIASGEAPATSAVAAAYLAEIGAWRERLIAALSGAGFDIPEARGITSRARQHMAGLLADEWHPEFQAWADGSAYNLSPLTEPSAAAQARGPRQVALDVLCWRAAIYDYLSDIWDVIGEPVLDMFECNAMATYLLPPGGGRCTYCLGTFDEARMHTSKHPCFVLTHVRAKWPSLPGFYERPDA